MSNFPGRMWLVGMTGTVVFLLVLRGASSLTGPPFHAMVWTGTFITLNLAAASLVGLFLDLLLGAAAANLYAAWRGERTHLCYGAAFGTLLWGMAMVIGMPLFDWISPLVRHGLELAPGPFLWRFGLRASLDWLAAALAYGMAVEVLIRAVKRGP